jgi:hypothetical protein
VPYGGGSAIDPDLQQPCCIASKIASKLLHPNRPTTSPAADRLLAAATATATTTFATVRCY